MTRPQLNHLIYRLYRRLFFCWRGAHKGSFILGVKCCSYCDWQESDSP